MATTPKGPMTWDAFFARTKSIYWPALAPVARIERWPGNDDGGALPVPDDVWQAALMVYPDPDGWLANPIPQLKGRTPLDALKRGQVDDVRALIMGVADFFLADPSEVRPWDEALLGDGSDIPDDGAGAAE
jgi:hypothetical protein